jgi:hypothetical protein
LFLDRRQHLSGVAILRCFHRGELCLGGDRFQDFEGWSAVSLPGSSKILNHERTSQPFKANALEESLQQNFRVEKKKDQGRFSDASG